MHELGIFVIGAVAASLLWFGMAEYFARREHRAWMGMFNDHIRACHPDGTMTPDTQRAGEFVRGRTPRGG